MLKESTLDFILTQPDLAKQVFRGMEKEVVQLRKQVGDAKDGDGQTPLLEEVEEWMVEQKQDAEILRKKMMGRSTEKRKKGKEDKAKKKRTKPAGSGRGQVGEDLPVVREDYHLKEPKDLICPCKNELRPTNKTQVTYQQDYIPAKLVRRQIVRWIYTASCGCVKTAPGRTTLVDGGQYGIDLACEIVARKYHDILPLERQAKMFKRDGGATITPSTLYNQTKHVAGLLEDVYEAIRLDIEAGYVRHADETRWRILQDVENKTQYAWVFRNDRHAYFTIQDTRSGEVPLQVMPGAAGALVADDYAGYNQWVDENELERVQCWAHTRRKFLDILDYFPECAVFLDLVSDLYKADRECRSNGPPTAKQRKAACKNIIKAIDVWRKNQSCLPKSKLRKALNYLNDNWAGLTAFLDDPRLPLDNNPAENALRTIVLGRKNFLFNRSVEGARVSAILFTICISCVMNEVDPKAYLRETILRIRHCRGFQLPYEFANEHETINLI